MPWPSSCPLWEQRRHGLSTAAADSFSRAAEDRRRPTDRAAGPRRDGSFVTPGAAPTQSSTPGASTGSVLLMCRRKNPGWQRRGQSGPDRTGVDATHPDLRQTLSVGTMLWPAGSKNWGTITGMVHTWQGPWRRGWNDVGVIGVGSPRPDLCVQGTRSKRYGQDLRCHQCLQRVTPDIRIIAGSCGTDLVWPSFEGRHPSPLSSGKLMVFSAGNYCTTSSGTRAGGDASCTTTPPADIKFPRPLPRVIAWAPPMRNDQVPSFSRSGPAMADPRCGWPPGVKHFFSTNLGGGMVG